MKSKNMNNSSVKTKKIIKTTFAKLLKEKGELSKITVNELTSRADINRGTFYIHYDSIYGVAEEFESEILQTLMIDDNEFENNSDINLYFEKVIKYLKDNEKIYKMLLVSREPLLFLDKLSHLVNEKIFNILTNDSHISKSKFLKFDISFFTDGIIYQILKYFTTKVDYSLDDVCEYSKRLFKTLFY